MLAKHLLRFFPPPRYLRLESLGIDLSDRSIKYCLVERVKNRFKLGQIGERELPSGALVGGQIRDLPAVQGVLRELGKITGRRLAMVALPEEPSYIIRLTLPALAPAELRSSIELQLEEHVPLPPAGLVFDYEILRAPDAARAEYDLVVSVFPAPLATLYRDLFVGAGWQPLAFELEAQAIGRAVGPAGATVAVADFGRLHLGLSVVADGQVLRTSTIGEISGDLLSRSLARSLGGSEAEAEATKSASGVLETSDSRVLFAILPAVSVLRDEIKRFISSWGELDGQRTGGATAISRLLLVGGGAFLPGLVEYLANGLPVPVAVGNVWQHLVGERSAVPPIEAPVASRYATAIGLGLRAHLPR